MENILNLKTYNKYLNLINEGLIIIPDNKLSNLIEDVNQAYRDKPYMRKDETHDVVLKAGKKIRITSRGSLRDIEIDGVTYDSIEQAACSIYDPYDKYYDLTYEIKDNILDFTFIPIIDTKYDLIRYTISKYSKGLKKYFDPHKVVKAVYSIDNILFYVKDDKDILRKYYFKIATNSLYDLMSNICYGISQKNNINTEFYLGFMVTEPDLPFTFGSCKSDFYALKDIINKMKFKGTTPLKYMVFRELSNKEPKYIKSKQSLVYNMAMILTNKTKSSLCKSLGITEEQYNEMMDNELFEITNDIGNKVNRNLISKFLNIVDNLSELKYYEELNLMWKVKFDDIPDEI